MINRFLNIIIILAIILNICGCAELKRKFVRKKEPKKEEPSFYQVEEYTSRPAHERYQEHYVLWHNWHLDLERTDGTSHKRDVLAADEALKHLTAMRDLLQEEKARELDIQIRDMEGVLAKLKEKKRDIIKETQSRKVIERIGRIIVNNFSYNRMKGYIISSE